jgi:hypothetical protein
MFNRIILTTVTLAISIAASVAKDESKKEECPTLDGKEIENLLRQAPSCKRAVALFEICKFGASGDVSLGVAVTEKCQVDFLGKLSPKQKRVYDREQQSCARKYPKEDGSMYRSLEAFCGAYVARKYSTLFLKATPSKHK